jgi:hypothetical protein
MLNVIYISNKIAHFSTNYMYKYFIGLRTLTLQTRLMLLLEIRGK